MKFSTREDIEAPIEHVWAQISNFDAFERQALRRGAEIARSDSQGAPGLTWRAPLRKDLSRPLKEAEDITGLLPWFFRTPPHYTLSQNHSGPSVWVWC